MMIYRKLVRDKIPEIIEKSGENEVDLKKDSFFSQQNDFLILGERRLEIEHAVRTFIINDLVTLPWNVRVKLSKEDKTRSFDTKTFSQIGGVENVVKRDMCQMKVNSDEGDSRI